jgi:ketosteroid isomerase-like protein
MLSLFDIAKSYIRAVQTGDQAAFGNLISPDVVWHQPGRNRFSGTHRGLAAVGSLIGSMMQVSGGTFAITRATRFMVNGDWVAIELEFAGQRGEMKLAQPGVDLLRIVNGRIVEVRLFSSDQDAEDAFWGK